MTFLSESLFVALVLIDLLIVGTSRLKTSVRAVAVQGVFLGMLPVLLEPSHLTLRVALIAGGSFLLKGFVFPWLLMRALRDTEVRREVEPFVGYTMSLLICFLALAASLGVGGRLPMPRAVPSPRLVPVAIFTVFTGLFLIVSRRTALNQVLGYLVLENGIFAFGVALALEEPLVVELGVLLDAFVAVFVMGIALFHINRELDHMETDRLSTLRDSP